METKLIKVATKYIKTMGPQSEIYEDQLFVLTAQVPQPQTEAGQAIVAWVKAEEATDFTLGANDEFIEMCEAIGLK